MASSPAVSLLLLLPVEIQRLVLEQLDRDSLFDLRLTCKALCYHATPIAFQQLHVWLEEESLQKLVKIAQESHLCTYVKSIGFGMAAFHDAGSEAFDYEVLLYQRKEYALSQGSSKAALLKPAWCAYRSCYKKQRALKESGLDLAMLTKAVTSFSSLETVDLIDFKTTVDGGPEGPKLLGEEMSSRKHMLNVSNPRILVPRGGRQLRVLLRALGATDRKLQELTLHLRTENFSDFGFYSPLSTKEVRFAWSAFAGLKRLGLCLSPIGGTVLEDCRRRSEDISLTTVLRAATELECLWLELPRFEWIPEPGECWKDIIQIQHFGKLKKLCIEGAVLNEAEFVSFLLHSCQRLKSLKLRFATVVEGRWDLILETIKDLPELQHINLKDLWHEKSRGGFVMPDDMDLEPLYDYLLKRRSDNPWQSMCQARLAPTKRRRIILRPKTQRRTTTRTSETAQKYGKLHRVT